MSEETASPLSITLDVAATLSALIWPVVVIVVLFLLRDKLPALLRDLAARVTKLDLGAVKLEFAKAKGLEPSFTSPVVPLDLRHRATAMQVNDSTAGTFLSQLRDPATGDYALVDLGSGDQWLTSRLYIMAVVFARVKGIQAFVFLAESSPGRKFVGWAETERIRWALARNYPWFEAAYAQAYASVTQDAIVVSSTGRLGSTYDLQNPQPGIDLMRAFLYDIQWPPGPNPSPRPMPPPPAPPPESDRQWVVIDESSQTKEHAAWVSRSLLEKVLGSEMHSSYVRVDVLQGKSRNDQIRLLLGQTGRFVAVVREDFGLDYLVDRARLLEQIALAVATSEAER